MLEFWNTFSSARYSSVVLFLLGILVAVVIYRVVTRRMRQYAVERAFKAQNVLSFLFIWRYIFMFVTTIALLFLFGNALGTLGITLAFAGSLLAWTIRNPMMNLTGWLMIILRKPYRIGDRVILGGMVGDVKDITINYTLLEQVGGTIEGEEKSGRSLLVPNQHLFGWTIVNYTLDDKYILDEVPVRLTYDSDIDRAEEIMIRHASEVTAEMVAEISTTPYVRFEMIPSGVVARVRYHVPAVDRQKVSTRIVDRIFREFARIEGIRFAYVMSHVHMETKDDPSEPPPQWLEDGLNRPWFSALRPQPVVHPQ